MKHGDGDAIPLAELNPSVCTYFFYEIAPPEGDECLSIEEVLARVAEAFPRHEFSPEEAREEAARRLSALEQLDREVAPESILKIYREGKPVRCRIAEPDSQEYLEFDVWEDQGMNAYPHPRNDLPDFCVELANRLATVLGYNVTQQEYD